MDNAATVTAIRHVTAINHVTVICHVPDIRDVTGPVISPPSTNVIRQNSSSTSSVDVNRLCRLSMSFVDVIYQRPPPTSSTKIIRYVFLIGLADHSNISNDPLIENININSQRHPSTATLHVACS